MTIFDSVSFLMDKESDTIQIELREAKSTEFSIRFSRPLHGTEFPCRSESFQPLLR